MSYSLTQSSLIWSIHTQQSLIFHISILYYSRWKSEARQNAALTSQIQQLTNEITIAKSRQYELSNVNGNIAVKNAHRINNEAQVTIRTQIQELKRLETKLRSEKGRNGELKKRQLVADSVAQKAREQMVARLKSQGEELREMRTLREQILTLKKEVSKTHTLT